MMRSMKSAKRETACCTDKKEREVQRDGVMKKSRKRKKLPVRKLPAGKLWMRILLYLLCLGTAAASICQAVFRPVPEIAGYLLYVMAFVLLCVGGFYLQRDIRLLRKDVLLPLIERNPLTRKAYRDYGYRTLLAAGGGTVINLAFTVYNGVWGIINHSVWFITMAVYYSLLGGIRFFSIQAKKRADLEQDQEKALGKEIAVMKRDGFLLLLMTTALGSIVFLKITGNVVTPYSETLVIATAAYTFYKHNIIMNSMTGLIVCTTVMLMGIRMVRASGYKGK